MQHAITSTTTAKRGFFGKLGAGLAAIITMMVVGTGQAMAAAAAITTELSDGKSSVLGIIALLAGIVAVLLLWAYVKRAR